MRWHGLTWKTTGIMTGKRQPGKLGPEPALQKCMRRGNSTVCSKEWGKKNSARIWRGRYKNTIRKKNNEKALLKLIKEGLAYISDGSPSIMQYAYDWSYEESPDFEPVGLDIQIMLTWSTTDAMAEEVETYINSDYHESYAITPVTTYC